MKTLYLVRHAKALQATKTANDLDRTLEEQGRATASSIAQKLKKQGILPNQLITSHAARAQETANIFAKELEYNNKDIRIERQIYELDGKKLLKHVKNLDDRHESVMLIGHSPAVDDLARSLLKNFSTKVPTSGVVCINFSADKWKNINRKNSMLEFFVSPGIGRKKFVFIKLEQDLQTKINGAIERLLGHMNLETAPKVKKLIKKASSDLAQVIVKDHKKNVKKTATAVDKIINEPVSKAKKAAPKKKTA